MPLLAALIFTLFLMLYHLPTWDASDAREVRIVLLLMSLRLVYELYILGVPWWSLR